MPELITSSFASRLQSKELSDEHLANWPSKESGTFVRFYSTDENYRHVWKYSQGRVCIGTTKQSLSALPFRPIELLLEIRWPAHTNVGHIWQMSLRNVLKPEMGVARVEMPSMLTKFDWAFERFFHVSRGLINCFSQYFAEVDHGRSVLC